MFDIRTNILNSLAVLGMTPYQFCNKHKYNLSAFTGYLKGGKTLSADTLSSIMDAISKELSFLKRFLVILELDTGDVAKVRVSAIDGDTAIKRIMAQPQIIEFIGNAIIKKVEFEEIEVVPLKPENYVLQKSEDEGWWVLTDKARKIVCKFQEGDFNNTQKNTILFDNDKIDELEYATAMREMSDYLIEYHKELI